jgi:uncharacterized protein (DUF2132 family)
MNEFTSNDPLHGITLVKIMEHLTQQFTWSELGLLIPINCFKSNPTIKSSLNFLRKTPWARKQVEDLYVLSISPGFNKLRIIPKVLSFPKKK